MSEYSNDKPLLSDTRSLKPSAAESAISQSHRARKRFGQNFLHDANIINRIIDSISPTADDRVIEIGPGQGALTRYLVRACQHLDVIELDRDLAIFLEQEYHHFKHMHVHQGDILKFDLHSLLSQGDEKDSLQESIPSPGSLRIVGNLPYNISTPVLFHLLKYCEHIRDMTFMLQLEVVERMAAEIGSKNYGRLGLMMQYHCQVEHLFDVPPTAFSPAPKVQSAIVRLTPHRKRPVECRDISQLETVIRAAFNQRRKTLRNTLKNLISSDELEALAIDPALRPEKISLAQYAAISDRLSQSDEAVREK